MKLSRWLIAVGLIVLLGICSRYFWDGYFVSQGYSMMHADGFRVYSRDMGIVPGGSKIFAVRGSFLVSQKVEVLTDHYLTSVEIDDGEDGAQVISGLRQGQRIRVCSFTVDWRNGVSKIDYHQDFEDNLGRLDIDPESQQ